MNDSLSASIFVLFSKLYLEPLSLNLKSAVEPVAKDPVRLTYPGRELITVVAAIAGIVFLAHFYLFDQFGLYEDDYLYVLPWLHKGWREVLQGAANLLVHPFQGRPLYFPAQGLLAHFAYRLGGLGLLHLVSFALLTLLGALVYCVLRQATSPRVAFLASLFFVLYPADTSRQIVMHQCATLLPMCICMCAILLYGKGRRGTSYAVAALTLLIYESTYFPFLLAPLFSSRGKALNRRDAVKHLVVFFLVVSAVFLIRMFLGESRAQEVSGGLLNILPKVLRAVWIGPLTSGWLLVQRPLDAWWHGQTGHWLIMLGAAAIFALGFSRLERFGADEAESRCAGWWLIGGGLLAWGMSYLLDFRQDYYPPVVSVGRLSGLHEVGAFGCCVALAGVLSLLDADRKSLSRAVRLAGIGMIGGLCGFGYEIQWSEYVANWRQQHQFWRQLVPLIQDVRPGEVILCGFDHDLGGIPATRGFTQFGQLFYNYTAFTQFLAFPGPRNDPPSIHGYSVYSPVDVIDGTLTIKSPFWAEKFWAKIPDGKVIFIKGGKGHLERASGELDLQGHRVFARPADPAAGRVTFTKFFYRLFEGESESRWWSLRDAQSYPPQLETSYH